MKNVLFVMFAMFCAPAIARAQVANQLHCEGGEVQVCTAPTADGGWHVLFDERARPRFDCDVATDTGVDLRCVDAEQVCADAKQVCEGLRGDWRWSERRCRCYQHASEPTTTPLTRTSPTPQPPVVVSVQHCTDVDRARLSEELDRIWEARLVVEDFGPLRERTVEVYGLLVQCDDGSPESRRLIELAENMIAALEPDDPLFPDYYSDDLELIREEIAGLNDRPVEVNVEVEPEENWCTDTHTGRFVCIALPIIAGLAAIAGGVILYDYLDDGSADGIIHW